MNVLGSFCPLPPFSTPKMTHSAGEFDVEQLTQDIATAFLNEPNPKLTGQFSRIFDWNDEENAFDVGFEPTAADCEAIGTMVARHIFAMCTLRSCDGDRCVLHCSCSSVQRWKVHAPGRDQNEYARTRHRVYGVFGYRRQRDDRNPFLD